MSHISTYNIKVVDVDMFLDICKEKGHEVIRGKQTIKQFARNTVDCIGSVKFKGWKYACGVNEKGEILYDHWGSQQNSFQYLGESIQTANEVAVDVEVEMADAEYFYKEKLENGDIQYVLEY